MLYTYSRNPKFGPQHVVVFVLYCCYKLHTHLLTCSMYVVVIIHCVWSSLYEVNLPIVQPPSFSFTWLNLPLTTYPVKQFPFVGVVCQTCFHILIIICWYPPTTAVFSPKNFTGFIPKAVYMYFESLQ